MANLTISSVHLVKGDDEHQLTLPAGVDINAGQCITPDPTSGKWALANAATAGNVGDAFIALTSVKAGESLTGVKGPSVLDVGEALAALNFAAVVYLSDTAGTLADTAGTVSTPVGRVTPGWAYTAADKLLRITLS
jgi:hypothetical protein